MRFIFLWIAFNALYGQPKYLAHRKGPEPDDIERFFDLLMTLDTRKRIQVALEELKWPVQCLAEDAYLNDDCWIAWYNRGLERLDERQRYCLLDQRRDQDLKGVFRRMYVLRKQLFHGCSSEQSSKNRDSLDRAVTVLQALVPVFIEILLESVEHSRLEDLLGELPYPPTIGGTG